VPITEELLTAALDEAQTVDYGRASLTNLGMSK
jgi:hypothetical protein